MPQALKIEGLSKSFPCEKGTKLEALKDISLILEEGKCLGLIGESGSGKSTLAKIIGGILPPDKGRILFYGRELPSRGPEAFRARRGMQLVFQNPFSSFSPSMTLGKALSESLLYSSNSVLGEREEKIAAALWEVGLEPERFLPKRCSEMSGGECQRAAIARALLCEPRLLVCDEITSALDVSIQAQIAALLLRLQKEKGLTLLFITHDIALVSCISDTVSILQAGRILESGQTRKVLHHPQHPYTQKLIDFC